MCIVFAFRYNFGKFVNDDEHFFYINMDTNIQIIKIDLIHWITTLEDEKLIEKLAELKQDSINDCRSNLQEDERKSILKGIDDADKGNLKPHSEAVKIYEKWL